MGSEYIEKAMELKVDLIGEAELISPAQEETPCKGQVLFLSNLDQVVLYPIETVHFFAAPEHGAEATANVAERLKETLRHLLVPYDFMCGRFRLNRRLFRLELLCNNAGVLFASAYADVALKEVGDLTLPNAGFARLVIQVQDPTSLSHLPLTTIQVTRFKCGGFTLGFSSNHVLLDGIAAGEFLANFASMVRGDGMRTMPKVDRTMFSARCPPHVEFDHHEYVWSPGVPFVEQLEPMMSYTEVDALIAATSQGHAMVDYIYKAFHANGKMLALLKQQGSSHQTCSSFEALAAHLWQCRTAAKDMDPSQFSTFHFAIDLRNVMNPPLPLGFAGNAVLSACARARVSDLLTKPLSFAVQKVQEARSLVTDEYVRSAIDCLEKNKGVPLTGSGYYVSAWTKVLQRQTFDFGWGAPIHAGPVLSTLVDFVVFLSDQTFNGLIVFAAMPTKQFSKLQDLFLHVDSKNTFFPYV